MPACSARQHSTTSPRVRRRRATDAKPHRDHHTDLPGRASATAVALRPSRAARRDQRHHEDAGVTGWLAVHAVSIAPFIAYFNYSNMPTVASVAMADLLERADIGAVWLLVGFILVIALLDIIIPGLLPKWAMFAPVFIPLFIRLDVAPQTLLAAYRLGDSPMNVITPLMSICPSSCSLRSATRRRPVWARSRR
jgi:AbgT putative transporter family